MTVPYCEFTGSRFKKHFFQKNRERREIYSEKLTNQTVEMNFTIHTRKVFMFLQTQKKASNENG